MKIPRQRAIERLQERIEARENEQTAAQRKKSERFFAELTEAIDHHEKAVKILKVAARAKTPKAAAAILVKNSDVPHLGTYKYTATRAVPVDHTVEAMKQQVELLKLSDDEYISVRVNSDLHTYLVG